MTDLAATPAKPARKGSRIMWALVALLLTICLVAVAAAFVIFQMHLGKPAFAGALTVVGLSLEGSMWCAAAAIGVTVLEARARIWRFLTGKGWTRD